LQEPDFFDEIPPWDDEVPPPWEHPDVEMAAPAVVVGDRVITQAPPGDVGGTEAGSGYEPAADSGPEVDRRPIECPPLDEVFVPGGPLAQALGSRYRARQGQGRMARLVRDALQQGRHAVIEAGTGIGKSFAYLIPIFWSGAAALVSTSNKALMNQLWEKDIPLLQQIAPRPVTAALLKGRSNYVCALRLARLREQVGLPGRDRYLALVRQGLAHAPTGDMEMMNLPPDLVARLTVSSRACRGRHCAHFKDCFYEEAKKQAIRADLVVTNHALLCHNTLLAENRILPVRPVLVVDEAHQLPRYAIEALTMATEHDQFWSLANSPQVRHATRDPHLLAEIREGYEHFLRAVEDQRPGRRRSPRRPARWALQGELQIGLALWDELQTLTRDLVHAQGLDEGDQEALVQQSEEIAATVRALSVEEPETHIRLGEVVDAAMPGSPESIHALYRPLEVMAPLRRFLFDAWPRVICTSATLSVGNDLRWFRGQVGLFGANGERGQRDPVIAATISSPFDYARQMVLYTPRSLLPVYDQKRQAFSRDYVSQLTAEVGRLLEASRGRALVLCTSRARMNQLYDALAPVLSVDYPCYRQGDYAQPELVARFKADGNAIIFATRGFWEGLDIQGDALALVILDKVPFIPYNDPVIRRQEERIRARNGNTFYELQLGPAILNLRQGAGRLIRSETDRGVIALLDGRLLRKSYGRQIITSMPEGSHTTDFEDVAAFLAK
jgi:ATP-dependent DNA helicase DinG